MRKLLLLFLSFSMTLCSAQVKIGLQAGLHYSTISEGDMQEISGTINFHGGVVAEMPIARTQFYFQPALLYRQLGYRDSNIQAADKNGFNLGVIDNHRIHYIQVPLYFLYRINSGKTSFKAGLGPWVGFNVGDRLTLDGGEKFGNNTAFPASTSGIKEVLGGLGINMSMEMSDFIIAFDVQRSLNGLYETQNIPHPYKWKVTTSGLSISYFILGR